MERLKSRAVVVLAVFGLFALSGVAMAATAESDDTVGNYYYDVDNDFLMFNVTSDEDPESFDELQENCTLDEEYGYSYDGTEIDLTPAVEDGCSDVTGDFAYGPNGQINHGTIMKLINGLYEGQQRGCVIREFAQTDLGKTDQQAADPDFEAPDPSEEEPIENQEEFTFENFTTNCLHGPNGEDVEPEDGDGNGGPPPHVLEKWDGQGPGKSGSAPGRNKGD